MILGSITFMKRYFQLLFIVLIFGCQSSKKTGKSDIIDYNQVLFTIATDTVMVDEFTYVYKKNNANSDSAFTKEDINDYLELYKVFKLKIAEAQSKGIDTTEAFKKEFEGYKEQLKKPYLTENKVTEQLVQEAFDRYQKEVNASHILINLNQNATPDDTLQAYQKAVEIREKAKSGTSFGRLAREYSDDPSAARNDGDLGYFSVFQMVYPFESAAFKTKEGEISSPVRTQFGYHLIKVNDIRSNQGTVTVSHLMLRIKPNKDDSVSVRNKIFELHEQAIAGVNWEQLVEQFSEDINSKNKGGNLPPFKVGQMPYAFQEASFALKEEGQISDPIMTPYGWHIIRLEKREDPLPFKEVEEQLRARVRRDSRGEINRKALINRLKIENDFIENQETVTMVISTSDSALLKYDEQVQNRQLFAIGNEAYTVGQFLSFVKKNQRAVKISPEEYMRQLYNAFVEKEVIEYEENHLEDKYVDYRMLVREYREGIMLFELMEDEVWQKAVKDSTGLKNYFETHKEEYKWGQRVKATIYNSNDSLVLNEIKNRIRKGDTLVFSKKELEKEFNRQTTLTLQVESGIYEKGDNSVIDKVDWATGFHEIALDNRYILVYIDEVLEEQIKPLNEIRGLVISDYQNKLESEWVDQLKDKYAIEVNNEALQNVYKRLIK